MILMFSLRASLIIAEKPTESYVRERQKKERNRRLTTCPFEGDNNRSKHSTTPTIGRDPCLALNASEVHHHRTPHHDGERA